MDSKLWEFLMNSSAIETNDVIDMAAEDEANDWEPNATSSLVEFWMSSDLPPKGDRLRRWTIFLLNIDHLVIYRSRW